MIPINKKSPAASGTARRFNQKPVSASQFKPAVAQLKNAVSAQSAKRPVAPPIYRPQATPKALQPKTANGAMNRKPSVAPPVYRPPDPVRLHGTVVQRSEDRQPPTTPIELDHSKKNYLDPGGRPVANPGRSGYVCAPTRDGQFNVCEPYSRFIFETMNTLSAPGQSSVIDYSKPSNSQGEPSIVTRTEKVNPSKYTCFPRK